MSAARLVVIGLERDAVVAHVLAHGAARIDPAAGRITLPASRGAAQLAGQPAQGLLQVGPLPLVHGLDPRAVGDPSLHHRPGEPVQVAPQQLGQIRDDAGQLLAQQRQRLLVNVLIGCVQPAEQYLLLRHRQRGVDAVPGRRGELARQAGVVQPVGLQLHGRAGVARAARAVLGQHDLVGYRRQVDLVRLLVQVVLLGEVFVAEEVPDVGRLAVAVSLLRKV